MATRTRGGGSGSGSTIALVVVGFMFFFSLLAAIIFKLQVDDARNRAEEAKIKLKQMVRPEEENRIATLKQQASKQSVVGQLLQENSDLKQYINASPAANSDSIRNEMESIDVVVKDGNTLIGEVRRLRAELASSSNLIRDLEVQLEDARRGLPEAEKRIATLDSDYQQAVEDLKANLADLNKGFNAFRADVDGQRQGLVAQLEEVRRQMDQSVAELEESVAERRQQVVQLQQRLEDLKRQVSTTSRSAGPDPTRETDGTITALVPDDNMAYIDRGRGDRVLLGMTFEVFDPKTGAAVDEFGDLRGKATIEVVSLSESSALARIVRHERGETINEGDLVANLVYDPNLTYEFYVFGDFDIDRTHQATVADRRRVETMIRQWGGRVAKELSYNTDFLVLGEEPELPDPLSPDVIDPVLIERHSRLEQRFLQYQELIGEAKNLSIPILNQNRFLALVGYYQR